MFLLHLQSFKALKVYLFIAMTKKKNVHFIPAIVWIIIITILSGYPGQHVPKVAVWQFDKLVHSVIYFILSLCILYAYKEQYLIAVKRFYLKGLIVLFGVFYGGFMEILQHYIFINRSGNWYDFIANAVGAILGVLVYPFVMKLLPINRL